MTSAAERQKRHPAQFYCSGSYHIALGAPAAGRRQCSICRGWVRTYVDAGGTGPVDRLMAHHPRKVSKR